MRRLWISPTLKRETDEALHAHYAIMDAIRADRERWARENGTVGSRPHAPRPPMPAPTATRRRVGYPDGRPHLVCAICFEPAHVDANYRCETCAAEVAWRVQLAQAGLRFVVD